VFKKICFDAGLRQIRFHDLRHSAAAILIAQGVHPKAIQELLRHAYMQTTMDTYGHLFDAVRRETADKMDEVLGHKISEGANVVAVKIAVNPDPKTIT
jgi:integrase